MNVYVNLMSDFGFKRVFGDPEYKDLLISFLNALFQGEIVVDDVVYDNVETIPMSEERRGLRYDIYCRTPDESDYKKASRHFIIEMQNENQAHFQERAIFYTSYAIYRQGEKGNQFDFSLVPVIGIFVMAFDWGKEKKNERMVERKGYLDLDTHEQFCDKVRMYFIKLPLAKKNAEECVTDIDKWTYCIKNLENMDTIPFAANNPVFAQLADRARIANLTSAERDRYEMSLKAMRDEQNIASFNFAEGEKRGLRKASIAIARNLKKLGMAVDQIAKATGLSEAELGGL